jgi:Peptidase family M23
MRARTMCKSGAVGLATGAVVMALAAPSGAVDTDFGDGDHGFGRMGPPSARTTSVSPSSGADFEMPFVCGQSWTGTSRSSHSPSSYTIDWNRSADLGMPALSSAPGVVIRAASMTGSYGRYVIVDHGGGYTTLYGHLNQIASTVGQVVDQGDLIGYVGSSGNSTGPHLHHEERLNGAYFAPYFHRARFTVGTTRSSANCNDKPVVGDWTGDGKADLGVYRTGTTVGAWRQQRGSATTVFSWGRPGDVPLVGNFGGDRKEEVGVRRLGSTSFLLRSATNTRISMTAGLSTDVPLTGDWDGNGRSELGLYRTSTHQFLRKMGSSWRVVTWGGAGQQPVSGDWNKDGRTDVGTFNVTNGTWTLRVPSGGKYLTKRFVYGRAGDRPVAGDFHGDKIDDAAIWRPSNGTFYQRLPKAGGGVTSKLVPFGIKR